MSAAESEAERIAGCVGAAYIGALKSGASYREASRAALAALRQHRPDVAAVLDGEAVAVPRVATWEMIDAARDAGDDEASWGGIYDAFLSRSPYAPPPEPAP